MAHATPIGPSDAQVDYRLVLSAGCAGPVASPDSAGIEASDPADGQFDYRAAGERPLRWIGRGCGDLDLLEGAAFTPADMAKARALMNGVDWRDGTRLVAPKVAAAPSSKLPGEPLLDAILLRAGSLAVDPESLFGSPAERDLYLRLARGVTAKGALHSWHVDLVGRVADAAGVSVLDTYGDAFMKALAHRDDRVDIRNRGYDVTLTLPKSFSVLLAYAPAELAHRLETEVFDVAAQDTLRYLEAATAYGMRGHHGDGRNATRMPASGFVGWALVHRTSRAGDPHHHVHLNLANVVRGADGKWSAPAAGGRDLMRHVHPAGAYMEARTRALLAKRFGIACARSERTGQWEITGIPDATLRLFSKRDREVRAFLDQLGLSWEDANHSDRRAARNITRDAKDANLARTSDLDLRARWQAEGKAQGDDPSVIASSAFGSASPAAAVDPEAVVQQLLNPETGLTSHRKTFDRAAAFAAVLEQLPRGVPDLAAANDLVDSVLEKTPAIIAMPERGPRHMSDVARFTSADVVHAEQLILWSAEDGIHTGAAVVPDAIAQETLAQHAAATGHRLSPEQHDAYWRLMRTGHGVDALIGVAGSGKTTLLAAAHAAWRAAGYSVGGGATAAVAAQNLQTQAGIPSTTVESLKRTDNPLPDVLVIDEAAMVDERSMATLLDRAKQQGTKVVLVGDPRQLNAVGVCGSFPHVHRIVDGLTLNENRRQRDLTEQLATAAVRGGELESALRSWAGRERLHSVDSRAEALADMATAWVEHASAIRDPLRRVQEIVMLAYTNDDVDALNLGVRTILRDRGLLPTTETAWRSTDGQVLALAPGDLVRVRQNLWRPNGHEPALLNGNRGIVESVDRERGAVVVWQRTAGGPPLRTTVSPAQLTAGALCHGYAITDHAAQGQSADVALVYPVGMSSNAFYAATTRHRDQLHLYIPLDAVEDDIARLRLGPVRDEAHRTARAIDGFARGVRLDRQEMVSLELTRSTDELESTPRYPRRNQEPEMVPVQPALLSMANDRPGADPALLRTIVERAAQFYAEQPVPTWVGPYLTAHGLTGDALPGRGYAPRSWTALVDRLSRDGFSDDDLIAAGVVTRSVRGQLIDRLRDRLVAPIADHEGVVALIGRVPPGSAAPKWLNTAASPIFDKGSTLYGLANHAEALRDGAVPVLVEGPLDAAAVDAAGAGHWVGLATLGTAVTAEHMHALQNVIALRGRPIVVAFDSDAAGVAASDRAYELLATTGADVRAVDLPAGQDPADVAAGGIQVLAAMLASDQPLVNRVIERRLAHWDDRAAFLESRLAALREVAPLVAALRPDRVVAHCAHLATRLDLSHEVITQEIVAALPAAIERNAAGDDSRRRRDSETLQARSVARPDLGSMNPPVVGR